MFSRIESFDSGSLLELASLHNINYDASAPNKEMSWFATSFLGSAETPMLPYALI